MRRVLTYAAAVVVWAALGSGEALAQTPPTTGFESGGGLVWGAIGFQGDVGGSLNSSGIGIVTGLPAEINTNTWGERYDAALIVRAGVGYNVTASSQVTFATHWEQAESDLAVVGLVGGQPLNAQFSDQQGWGIDAGYRYIYATRSAIKPFIAAALGFERTQDITGTLSVPALSYQADDVPFYDDSWIVTWRFGGGFLWDFATHFGIQGTVDLKYSGVLSDQAGLGQIGFERVNDTGNRWTLPILGGVYVKF